MNTCLVFAVVVLALVAGGAYGDLYTSPLSQISPENVKVDYDHGVVLSLSTHSIEGSADWVMLQWSGLDQVREDDWIGVYTPSTVNIQLTTPVKYQFASAGALPVRGTGMIPFYLVNMREDYMFAYFRNGLQNPRLVAKSQPIKFRRPNEPLQVHLSITEDHSEMRVQWVTGVASRPIVQYGLQSGRYTHKAAATSFKYTREDMCGSPAKDYGWRDPGLINTAVMHDLEPAKRYYYKVGEEATGWSQEWSFVSMPTPGSKVSFVAFGDMGKAELDGSLEHWEQTPSLNTTDLIAQRVHETDFLIHIGDIAYAVGYGSQWDEFYHQVERVAARIPYQQSIGNHERDWPDSGSKYTGTDSGGECGVPYNARFWLPHGVAWGTGAYVDDEPWYSFDYGAVHIIMTSTEHEFMPGSKQHNFVLNDLKSVDRETHPWVILTGHRMMYTDSTDISQEQTDIRWAFEDLMMKYDVTLGLWGHHHSYQRTCPMFYNRCKRFGFETYPVHAVIGNGGQTFSDNFRSPAAKWIRFRTVTQYGFTRIEADSQSLKFEFYSDVDGKVKDRFVLHKTSEGTVLEDGAVPALAPGEEQDVEVVDLSMSFGEE